MRDVIDGTVRFLVERDRVVIGQIAQEDHLMFRPVRNPEAEHGDVELARQVNVHRVEHNMAEPTRGRRRRNERVSGIHLGDDSQPATLGIGCFEPIPTAQGRKHLGLKRDLDAPIGPQPVQVVDATA